jgi:hypothetical protein
MEDSTFASLVNELKSFLATPTLKYEPGTIVAEGNFVIVHGRFSNFGLRVNWIAADVVSPPRRNARRTLGRN